MRSIFVVLIIAVVAATAIIGSENLQAAPVSLKKSVTKLDEGTYIVKISLTSKDVSIYAFEISDPKGSIVDVYSPKSWCMLTDGGVCLARTLNAPLDEKKALEFIFYTTDPDVRFVWTFFDAMKQIGSPEIL